MKKIVLAIILFFIVLFFSIYLTNLKISRFTSEKEYEIIDSLMYILEIKKIKTNVTYIEKTNESYFLGIEVHKDNLLTFGIIPINSPIERVRRIITLNNLENSVVGVKIFCDGNICDFINISKPYFILKPKENREIEIAVENKNITGYYEGYIYINVLKPKNKIWEVILYFLY
ncbi:MAG: hypothetical protein QW678_00455 [Candidatus Aenigmatarchaeota archaeon]